MKESAAREKHCPIGDYNCKASVCMMWVETKAMKCLKCGAQYEALTRCLVCKTQLDIVEGGNCWMLSKSTEL